MTKMFEESDHTEYTNEVENTSLLTSFEEVTSSNLFSTKPIHSKDLYAAIQKFQLTTKTLENDVILMSNWLDSQKEHDPQ
ncbi:916_t:CDS:2 [Cetraspora pellucida]|uniref:916_t:CDS:1 n=1 Tax=Cetraspora pellucida TaxID=1433469 RepID=A0A9N9A668_9GLOM|nr:916_t:CDS:2 [Cetraspora pellucida]